MPKTDVASFKVKYLQILDAEGKLLDAAPPELSPDRMKELFRMMVLIRELDRLAVNYQRQGRMGTYAPVEGQEACQVGSVAAMTDDDWVFPAFREQGMFLMRGLPMRAMLLYFMGCEEGNRVPEGNNTFPVSVPVASQIPIAVGCAMALKLKKRPGAAITYFGDGATSEGDFAEALNFAAVYKTPNLFICQNNQWAISVPRSLQSASQTLAQKGIACGVESLQVDGNDLLAVYAASKAALERARKGEGATFLELVTYRRRMHTTADDPKKYQDEKEHEERLKNDPVQRFGNFLKDHGIIDDDFQESIRAEAEKTMKTEYAAAEEIAKGMSVEDIFKYTYEQMPEHLRRQLEELKSYGD